MNPPARNPGEPAGCWGWGESAPVQTHGILGRGAEWDWACLAENPLFMPHFGLAEPKPQMPVGPAESQIVLNSAGLRLPWPAHAALRDIAVKRDPEDVQGTIGLNLGARTYFSSSVPVGSGNGFCRRPPRANSPGGPAQIPHCQAEGCRANLMNAKHYHRRHRVCELHSKASTVTAGGLIQRFCQQCSRFHVLSEFDEGKRSCRKRLADHNRRRRKRPQAAAAEAEGGGPPAGAAGTGEPETAQGLTENRFSSALDAWPKAGCADGPAAELFAEWTGAGSLAQVQFRTRDPRAQQAPGFGSLGRDFAPPEAAQYCESPHPERFVNPARIQSPY